MGEAVTIFEVGPRDGLQNEKALIPTADKIRLVNLLSGCGMPKIEVTSFVSPKWVPQLADAAEVMAGIHRVPDVTYAVLTPNMQGLEAAISAHPDEIAIFASASEGFSLKNINCSIGESLKRFRPVARLAAQKHIPVRGYVSCVTDCPYDGSVAPSQVANVTAVLLELGCYEISLGDTIGAGTPETVERMLHAVLQIAGPRQLAGHFHDTQRRAIANVAVCLDHGLRTFDSSIGGLGGCPYAPGARGNVATERVVQFLEAEGFCTGINPEKLAAAADFANQLVPAGSD